MTPAMAVFSYETADSLLVETSTGSENYTGDDKKDQPENGGSTSDSSGMNGGKTTNFNIWDDEEDY